MSMVPKKLSIPLTSLLSMVQKGFSVPFHIYDQHSMVHKGFSGPFLTYTDADTDF